MYPNVYSQINIHLVFAVLYRENVISDFFRLQLCKYIGGILNKSDCYPLAINAHNDHIHIFYEHKVSIAISDLIKDIKSNSSKWINENHFVPGHFEWQRGAGVFSHSKSDRDKVIKYIINQEEHHKSKSFKEEYLSILQKLDIKYSEDYLFQWY